MATFRKVLGYFVNEVARDVEMWYYSVKHNLHLSHTFFYDLARSIADLTLVLEELRCL